MCPIFVCGQFSRENAFAISIAWFKSRGLFLRSEFNRTNEIVGDICIIFCGIYSFVYITTLPSLLHCNWNDK